MSIFAGAPSAEQLRALRERVKELAKPMPGLPLATLAALATSVPPGVGITVDPGADGDAAGPLVVVWSQAANQELLGRLSVRESEVARLVGDGLRNKEIAAKLFISEATVKDHVHHILKKAGLSSRTELVRALTRR